MRSRSVAMRIARALPFLLLALAPAACQRELVAGGPKPVGIGPYVEPLVDDAATWERWRGADVAVVAPRALLPALAPLVAHRESLGHAYAQLAAEDLYARLSKGKPDTAAIQTALERLVVHTSGKLRFVLLVGDVQHTGESLDEGFVPVPTYYLPKLDYEHHKSTDHTHPLALLGLGGAEHDHDVPHTGELYPSDHPYSVVSAPDGSKGKTKKVRLAVGRLPARTVGEVSAFAKKLVAYESDHAQGAWRRTISVVAGPANYGPVADGVIESMANQMFDQDVSYDFDLRFTFAKLESPYAYRFDRLQQKFVDDLDQGALIAAYVGHGATTSFDDVDFHGGYYMIGTADDAARLEIPTGPPLFFSFSCDTGAFDRPDGRKSLAEALVLNPRGPIAAFASSRESHPYPNALYGKAVIEEFVNAKPRTIGEGILAMEEKVKDTSIAVAKLLVDTDETALKEEHAGLYNLLGDPAAVLQYASSATVTLSGDLDAKSKAKAGGTITAKIAAPGVSTGTVVVTLETKRSTIRGTLVQPSALDAMTTGAAFEAMAKNYAVASDKVVVRKEVDLSAGSASATFDVPTPADTYVVKVLAQGGGQAAVGHATFVVP